MDTVLRSRSKTVTIGREQPFCIIGERINPTGRKKFAEELRGGDLSTVSIDAVAQVEAGADMLDINAGIPLVDEPELLKGMLTAAQNAVEAPICIDSSVIEALEAGLSVYEGRALVNSVTAEDDRLEEILPLVARHGAAVIGLANDETGIPETPQKRLELARKIVSAAGDHGIAAEDVVIDPLAMTVGADTEAVTTTLETIRLIRDELGVNMCLGASNVSFGLPQRAALNAAFLPMAMTAGLTSAIMSTAPTVVDAVRAVGPAAGPRSVGSAVDRRAPGAPGDACGAGGGHGADEPARSPATRPRPRGADRPATRARRRRGPGQAAVPARRRRRARAQRHPGVRRRELERDRDRLDVRRPRHLQEVQGADRLGRRAGRPAGPTGVHRPGASRGMAAGVPGRGARATWWSRCRRCRRVPRRRSPGSGGT